tara:strand:- start:33304 stop:33906 length:603 start_codon:yes stop_codon:yes gene_type:complete
VTREKVLAIAGGALAVLVIVISGFVFVANRDVEPEPVVTTAPEVPAEVTVPDEEPVTPEDPGFGSDDDSAEKTLDFSAQNATGEAAMTAFLTYDTSESQSARYARLGMFADAEAVAQMLPSPLSEQNESFAGYQAKLSVDSVDGVAWLEEAGPTSDTFIVFVSYTLTESIPGQDRVTRDRGEWQITIDRGDVSTIVGLDQ